VLPRAHGTPVPRLLPSLRPGADHPQRRAPLPSRVEHQRPARLHRDHPPVAKAVRGTEPKKTLLKLQLLPRWLTSADFRLAFTSGVSANASASSESCSTTTGSSSRNTDEQPEGVRAPMLLLAAGTALAPQATLRRAAEEAARARELPWPRGSVGDARASHRRRRQAHRGRAATRRPRFPQAECARAPLVGDLRSSAEMLGDGGKRALARLPGRVTWTTIAVSGTPWSSCAPGSMRTRGCAPESRRRADGRTVATHPTK
jgi:hypothetical protein